MKYEKMFSLFLSVIMIFVISTSFADIDAADYPAVVPGVDLGGADVKIMDYWSGNGGRSSNPTEEQQATYA